MSLPAPPFVSHPLRILHIFPPETEKSQLLEGDSLAISTPYYSAKIPIWHDQIALSTSAIKTWEIEWLSEEAAEVVRSIGAWVVAIQKPSKKDDLETVRILLTTLSSVIAHHTSSAVDSYSLSNEPLLLCLGIHTSVTPRLEILVEEWEDFCQGSGGWEWIDGEAEGTGRNIFGEKIGIARLKEALEAHEWESGEGEAPIPDALDFEDVEGSDEITVPIAGDKIQNSDLRKPMLPQKGGKTKADSAATDTNAVDDGEDDEVQELESMMLKLQAVKDMGVDLPEAQRRKLAAKAIRDVMEKM